MEKNEAIRKCKNFDELLDIEYGKIGTASRDKFEKRAERFILKEVPKACRRDSKKAG